jgi:alpha-beta hydrolase superfamily lysophospholipase
VEARPADRALTDRSATVSDYLDFAAPRGLRVRGTVLVVPGRGETSAAYRRFGARIATDAYTVRVLASPVAVTSARDTLAGLDAALSAALAGDLARPLVLVGTDTSAVALAALVARSAASASADLPSADLPAWWPDALVLASLPGYGSHEVGGDWDAELNARSHCPVHRGVLSDDTTFNRGALATAVDDELLDLAYASTADVPQLLLVGDSDPLADRQAITRAAKVLPSARLSVVRDGHHDVLNDLQHRSVAAEVVSFLEVVRGGRPLTAVVSAELRGW